MPALGFRVVLTHGGERYSSTELVKRFGVDPFANVNPIR